MQYRRRRLPELGQIARIVEEREIARPGMIERGGARHQGRRIARGDPPAAERGDPFRRKGRRLREELRVRHHISPRTGHASAAETVRPPREAAAVSYRPIPAFRRQNFVPPVKRKISVSSSSSLRKG